VEGTRSFVGEDDIGIGFIFGAIRGVKIGVGLRRETGEYSLGMELDPPMFRIGYAASVHPVLGVTHAISLSIGRRERSRELR
jgi:hypothetical protein